MAVTWPPGPTADKKLQLGDENHSVLALQMNENLLLTDDIVEDGVFGDKTFRQVKAYQRNHGLTEDGIAGYATQLSISLRLAIPGARPFLLPAGLPKGMIVTESDGLLGTVNWDVAPGVDCGPGQDRIRWPDFGESWADVPEWRWRQGFNAAHAGAVIGQRLRTQKDKYYGYVGWAWAYGIHQRAWMAASLSHNWPAGADKLARSGIESFSTADAQWVMDATRNPDTGVPRLRSERQWVEAYVAKATAYVTTYTA